MRWLEPRRDFDPEFRIRCEFGATTAALISSGIGLAGTIGGASVQSGAAKAASNAQVTQDTQALDFEKQVYADQQKNQAPFLAAGQGSLSKIMDGINNGTFGPGSVPLPAQFKAPTLEDAQNSPGYQFTQQQGNKGILQGASAAGGAVSGGTLKALAGYDANLANSTYGDVFNRNLATYNAGLTDYQAQLAGQGQAFNQLSGVAGLGQTATQNIGQVGLTTSSQASNTLSNIGQAQAAGIVGKANADTSAIGGTANILQSLAAKLISSGGGGG